MNQTLLIDFDSTIITKETLDVLAAITLIGDPNAEQKIALIKQITEAGMNGEITFEESLSARTAAFTPHRIHMLQTVQYLQSYISPSFLKHREEIALHADDIYIISGGFREPILPIASQFGIDASHVFANDLHFDENGRLLGIDTRNPLAHEGGKVAVARQLKEAGRLKSPTIVIGDGTTDRQILDARIANKFFAYTETVTRENALLGATKVTKDFTKVAELLGWYPTGIEQIGMRGEAHPPSLQMRK